MLTADHFRGLAACDRVAYLHRQHALPHARFAKHQRQLTLPPKLVKQRLCNLANRTSQNLTCSSRHYKSCLCIHLRLLCSYWQPWYTVSQMQQPLHRSFLKIYPNRRIGSL